MPVVKRKVDTWVAGCEYVDSRNVYEGFCGPFTLADSYIGGLVYNRGIGLLSNIYTLSITYYIYANLLPMTPSLE